MLGNCNKIKHRPGPALWFAAFILVCLAWLTGCGEQKTSQILAKVNGQEIGEDEFRGQAAFMGLGIAVDQLGPDIKEAILEDIISRKLVLNEAADRGIILEPEELDHEERLLRGSLGHEAFESALSDQGIDYATWRRTLADDLLMRKTLDLIVAAGATVTTDEITSYYRDHGDLFTHPVQVHALHSFTTDRATAEMLVKRIKQGEEMASVARELGVEMPMGDTPVWLSMGLMSPKVDKLLSKLKPGEVSGVIASDHGYHILIVKGRRPAGKKSLPRAALEIQRILSARKKEALAAGWLKDLRSKADVWLDPDFIKGATGQKAKEGK